MQRLCRICTDLQQREQPLGDEILHFETLIDGLAAFAQQCQGICQCIYSTVLHFIDDSTQQQMKRLALGAGKGSPAHFRVHGADEHYNELFAIELYADRDSEIWPWSLFQSGPSVPRRPDSVAVLNQCRSWLDFCKVRHQICAYSRPKPACTVRMLTFQNNLVRLVEGFDAINDRFAALSHCWGDAKHLVTTKASLPSHIRNIPLADLPPTFRQALEVCVYLGINHLWIDSLCIVQDDVSDWAVESRKMGVVYETAEIVISADAARSSSEGLFMDRIQEIRLPDPFCGGPTVPVSLYGRLAIEHAHHTSAQTEEPSRDPLSQRAWVLQEWLLGRRVLHFGSQEIVWDCRDTLECECGGFSMLSATNLHLMEPKNPQERRVLRGPMVSVMTETPSSNHCWLDLIKLFTEVVTEYSVRRLTKYRDRLVAINGIAEAIVAFEKVSVIGQYTNGIFGWQASTGPIVLALQLLWSRLGDSKPHARPQTPVAPTWSWAAIDEAVEWFEPQTSTLDDFDKARITVVPDTALKSCSTLSKVDSPGSGILRLRTYVLQAEIRQAAVLDWGQCLMHLRRSDEAGSQIVEEVMFSLDINISDSLQYGPATVLCARILDFSYDQQRFAACMILVETSLKEGTTVICERIGVVADEIKADWFDGATEREMVVA